MELVNLTDTAGSVLVLAIALFMGTFSIARAVANRQLPRTKGTPMLYSAPRWSRIAMASAFVSGTPLVAHCDGVSFREWNLGLVDGPLDRRRDLDTLGSEAHT